MNVLHLLRDGPSDLSKKVIEVHGKEHEVQVIDLSQREESYEQMIDDIFSADRVISW